MRNVNPPIILTLDDVRAYNTIKVDNNFQGVLDALKKNGVPFLGVPSRESLGSFLFSLYNKNHATYTAVMKDVPFDDNINNYTTDGDFQASVANAFN